MTVTEPGFDFDTMAHLAHADPVEFDRARAVLIEDFIRTRRRPAELANLQHRLDAERSVAGAATPTVEELSQRMWRSFGQLTREFERLAGVAANVADQAPTAAKLGAGEAAPESG